MELLMGALLFAGGFAAGQAAAAGRQLPVLHSSRRRRMQRQLENFINYDGSERGQMSLADGEFSEGDL